MKINQHEPQNLNKKAIKLKENEVNIAEKNKNLKKFNKNVDNSGSVNPINGANLNYNA